MSERAASVADVDIKQAGWSRFYRQAKLFITAFVVLLILFVITAVVAPGILSPLGLSSYLMSAALLTLPALGQATVITGGGGGIDLSAGAIMSLCALLAPAVRTGDKVNVFLSIITVILVGGLWGLANGGIIKFLRVPPMILTLIMGYVIDGFTWWVMKGKPITTSVAPLDKVSTVIFLPFRVLTIVAIIVVVLMQLMLSKSRYGKSILLVGNNSGTAALSGLHVDFIRVSTYVIAGALYGIGGLLLTGYSGTTAIGSASDYTMLSIAAAVIGGTKLTGGVANYVAVAMGAMCLTLLTLILQALNMEQGMRLVCQGALLFIILLINNRLPKLS